MFPMARSTGITALLVLCASLASCANTARDEEIAGLRKEVAELRQRLERAEQALAESRAIAERPQRLYEQALMLEQGGKGGEAVKLYVRAARSGYGKAALRLAQIYEKGISGVSVDYAMALKWYVAARTLGEDVPAAKKP